MRACFLILLGCAGLFAQQTAVQGVVTDSSGAVIAQAIVRLTPTNQGTPLATVSSEIGLYSFPTVVAESYRLRVEAPGFTPAERTFSLLVGQSVTIDFQLKPSAATSTVEVSESAIEIDVTSSQVGGNVDPGRMKDTPLNGRNWMELSMLGFE